MIELSLMVIVELDDGKPINYFGGQSLISDKAYWVSCSSMYASPVVFHDRGYAWDCLATLEQDNPDKILELLTLTYVVGE